MLPEIVDVKAYGSFVHVELLTTQETLKTKLTIANSKNVPLHEAYVLDIGPQVPPEYGLEVGHRVFIDGGITFSPDYGDYRYDENGRRRGMVMYASIKGRSVEA